MSMLIVNSNIMPKIILIVCSVTGGRQSADIVNWLKKKTGPPAAAFDTVEKAKAAIEKEEVVVIGFFKVIDAFV